MINLFDRRKNWFATEKSIQGLNHNANKKRIAKSLQIASLSDTVRFSKVELGAGVFSFATV